MADKQRWTLTKGSTTITTSLPAEREQLLALGFKLASEPTKKAEVTKTSEATKK